MTHRQWFTTERLGQVLQLVLTIFLAIYLVLFVGGQRVRLDCQDRVNASLIESLNATREAAYIERTAMQTLVQGLLTPNPKVAELLKTYQDSVTRAAVVRVDNPLPDPNCS